MRVREDPIDVLHRVPLFARLSDEALALVAERTVVRSVPRGHMLFRHGKPCTGLHVVVDGRVQVYRSSHSGREQVLHTHGPGQALAEVPLFDAGPYPASARALAPTRVLFLPLASFQELYRSHPEIADAVIRELGRRLRRAVGLIGKISLKTVRQRVAATLLEHASAADSLADGGEFALGRRQEDLAAELATTRESVARALSSLRRDGLIDQRGDRVRILDLAELAAASEG